MDVATAKPTAEERAAARHHCLDLVDPDEAFTVAHYRTAALAALEGIAARGGIGLLVGGTGLYLRTVARGLPIGGGDSDAALRAELETRLEREGVAALADELRTLDPVGAETIDLRNPRRVTRALERARLTGSATPPTPQGYPAPMTWLGLSLEAKEHRRRIRARIDEHFEAGLLDEAARLRERYPEDLPAFSAMGYREAFDVLAGRCTLEEAKERDTLRTWAYARRQRTWFRSEPGVVWLEAGERVMTDARAALDTWCRQTGRDVYAGRE